MHPWHDIEIGEKKPEIINIVVEIPKESTKKYELDKKTGMMKLDRFLYASIHYPGDYGFIPKTLWEDNDPLDVFVITHGSTVPMTICEVKPIGVLRMVDNEQDDEKIIAVHANDPRYSQWDCIEDVPKHMIKELMNFFSTYKIMENKKVDVQELLGKKEAYDAIKKGIELYNKEFKD